MNVLISGAGIGGLALAHWLHRHGISATVVERAPALRNGGQAIDIRGAARTVVERMGLLDAIRARHTGTHGIVYVDRRGAPIARMGGDDFGDSGGVVAEIEILRNDLVRILHEAAPEAEYLFDDHITALHEGADGITATFHRARSRTFDAVIGADGLRSGVRALAFGADRQYVRDLGMYGSYFAARSSLDLDGWEVMYNLPAGNGVGGRVLLLYPVGRDGEVRAMFSWSSPTLGLDRRVTATQKAALAEVFAGAGWEIPRLLDQMWRTDDFYFARTGATQLDGWSRGRATLLGDAAFAGSLGMGTSMALVGAYVLAGELATTADPTSAFRGYEAGMRDYVTRNLKRPPGSDHGFAPASRAGIWLRNQVVRTMTKLPGKSAMTGNLQAAANAITLKDYPLASDAVTTP
ncbi:2-polyprenyl-6-methoxyphenol hydroxylase-like FAD-dependent oxidoreductase [Asanoa ferruginea]|uniref:2-polyprenyl-6-methoxyphenol hydroxylase-like FAD-dependent oxidoreductase n=1 Tax=Asanoa ferruginea TaxID=53367 RepID=A0A3D9ZD79_9ACTN|nr:FAD-dependent monooxygenase [Asanoa ferruginea]REF94869.1 2-polyprenyl-6-methoxyphenol hydroxylase-like FAD-dependent oxidoreductase [Asanoa ferruginea]GIF45552.1 FAD-dependent oxidoreductase [Asanoa ferruginea]